MDKNGEQLPDQIKLAKNLRNSFFLIVLYLSPIFIYFLFHITSSDAY